MIMKAIHNRLLATVFTTAVLLMMAIATLSTVPVFALAGGPVVLMGIDAEDEGVNGHGPITSYEQVVNSILSSVTNGGSGILVIGCGKSATDDVTKFWNQIATDTGNTVTCVNEASNIASQSFAGFAMIGVVSNSPETPSGGLIAIA